MAGMDSQGAPTPTPPTSLDQMSAASGGPLSGLRVLEIGSLIAGPFCTRLLAEFGADVIKLETPGKGDELRRWGQQPPAGGPDSLWWLVQGRNKRSVTLDLHAPRGQSLAREIATRCDVVVENFRPGKVAEWGLDYDSLRKVNPGLVYVSISGYGQTGPYRDRPGFGAIGESMGGLRYVTGSPDRPPTRVGVSLGDSLTGLYGAFGAVMALHQRDRNGGQGQLVDVALYEAVFSMMESTVTDYDARGIVRERTGGRLTGMAPTNTYRTRDDKWIVIGGNNDAIFRRFMRAIGRPALAEDPAYATNPGRVARADELDDLIGAWTATVDLDEALRILEEAGVPSGPIYSAAEIAKDPHYWAREMLQRTEDPRVGSVLVPGVVPKLSDTPGGQRWLGQPLGADTESVLTELLGISREEVEELRAEGVV